MRLSPPSGASRTLSGATATGHGAWVMSERVTWDAVSRPTTRRQASTSTARVASASATPMDGTTCSRTSTEERDCEWECFNLPAVVAC